MIFDALGVLALGEIPITVIPTPSDEIFDPIEVDECFTNDEILSIFGGQTPWGIPNWVADPDAVPAETELEPLDIDQPSSDLTYDPLTETVSVHHIETPADIQSWTADPNANPVTVTFTPLKID